jgi:hypothetical protein
MKRYLWLYWLNIIAEATCAIVAGARFASDDYSIAALLIGLAAVNGVSVTIAISAFRHHRI